MARLVDLTFLRFYAGLERQGVDRTKFIYYGNLQPYLSYWGVFWSAFCILINGFYLFWDFKPWVFVIAYINIPIFFGLYLGYKLRMGSKIWNTDEMDFIRGIPTIEETEESFVPKKTFWEKILRLLF